MTIRDSMTDAISSQINEEIFSAYLYFSMANYFHSINLSGFAHWMEKQAAEEIGHAMKFHKYLVERNASAKLAEIAKPPVKWESPLAVFEDAYAHEQKISAGIGKLIEQAAGEKDHATSVMLQWFITEQVEEEANALAIVEKLKLAGTSSQGLVFIDHELAQR
jgi:ferritin